MTERGDLTERDQLMSELHFLNNHLLGMLAEVKMALMREDNAFDARRARTVTQQTHEFLRANRHILPPPEQPPTPISYGQQLREQAGMQDDAKQSAPPYIHLIQ